MPTVPDDLGRLLHLDPAERVAVRWCGHQLTYAESHAAVEALTGRLSEMGAARTNVLVFAPLCPAYLVGLLAAIRAGAVPVPVDSGLTRDQYARIEDITRPSAVLTSDVSTFTLYQGAAPGASEVILDAATGRIVSEVAGGADRAPRFARYDAGYLIPTSGSTGEAKAIVGSRAGLHAFLSWFIAEFQLGPQDRCAAATRVNFDPSLRELLGVLACGGTLCLPEIDAQLDFSALARHLAGNRPTVAFLVPSLARRVGDVLRTASARLPDLRLGFFAGEVLPARVVEQWSELAPNAEFVNLYGLTEATLAQLYRREVRAVDGTDLAGMPVGRPRPGVSVTLDQAGGDRYGEVVIASSAPALGVLTDAPGPRNTFRVDPIPPRLPTGDVGYWDDRGELNIVGRLGNTLKVSGRRVPFDRFVDTVEGLAGVTQCVVVDRQGPHAFVAIEYPPHRAQPLLARVHDAARRLGLPRMPIHLRTDLPLLRSGKVDRIALAASIDVPPAGAVAPADRAAPDPAAGVTPTLLKFLGLDAAAASTPFVEAGLSSLDMMEFALEVNQRFGLDLSVEDCFGHRDVASLALVIENPERVMARDQPTARTPAAAVCTRSQRPTDEPEIYPLSTRQLAYMAVCMTDGNANWCNLSREIRIDRIVTRAEVAASADELIARHDALRLALTADWSRQTHTEPAGVRCQILVEAAPRSTHAEHRALVRQARARAVAEPIDPSTAAPLRLSVVHGDATSSVIMVAHHLFIDGLSMDLLAEQLRSALLGRRLDDAAAQQSYRRYCLATQRPPQWSPRAPGAEYWRAFLHGAGQTQLPEATGDEAALGELVSRPLGVLCSRVAHRVAAATGVSVFSVVLAAFDLAVSRTFGPRPLTIVVPVQVREEFRTSTAGMFMSQLAVRSPGSATLRDNARAFAEQLELGRANSAWEFDQRIAELGLAGARCFPLSTVLFNQHPRPRGLPVRDLGEWVPRMLGRKLRYQLQGEVQVSGAEMALSYYYRRGITVDRPDVIDELHAQLLAALTVAGRTLNVD